MERSPEKRSFRLRNFIKNYFRHLKMADLQLTKSLELQDIYLGIF
jgi:hypothetical protein